MKIALGITGSIAAFKAIEIGRILLKKGVKVTPVLTKEALEFVTPLSLTSLLKEKVYYDMFELEENKEPVHIKLSRETELMVIAPATFHFISKAILGLADDMLSLLFHTSSVPKIIAPAMHPSLYENEIMKNHINTLIKRGVFVIEPEIGELSDLEIGKGRLPEPKFIAQKVMELIEFKNKLKNRKILLTFGRTEEEIDPVRVITNKSSGKMGFSLYKALKWMGAEVKAIAGKTDFELPDDIEKAFSVDKMKEKVIKELKNKEYDALIMVAAVSDFKPVKKSRKKLKKEGVKKLNIEFNRTEDILKSAKEFKKKTKFIGFSLEDKFDEKIAMEKMKKKNIDMIILNTKDTMGKDSIKMKIFLKNGTKFDFPELYKIQASFKILEKIKDII